MIALDFQEIISGNPSIAKDQADKLGPAGFANVLPRRVLDFIHGRYDLRSAWDSLNGEALKYGTFVGRLKMVELGPESYRGTTQKIPMLIPRTIKHTYLDDSPQKVLDEGLSIRPLIIEYDIIHIHDLWLAASGGKTNPRNQDGGWMQENAMLVKPQANPKDHAEMLEAEGDLTVELDGEVVVIENGMFTVAIGSNGPMVVRFRINQMPFSTYLVGKYHHEDVLSPYGVGPLMKGAGLQAIATLMYNEMSAISALQARPPMWVTPDDPQMKALRTLVEPGLILRSQTKPEPITIGNLGALSAALGQVLLHYADVTGTTRPRLGAQTKSHQTAFAIGTEQTRGAVRTVDYVRTVMHGPMQNFLHA
jgi:hypothetical protein